VEQMADTVRINYLIDCGLIITFLASFITGIIKFPEWTRYFNEVFLLIPASILSQIHDILGIAMGTLVLLHLVLHRKWIVAMTKSTFKRKEK
jgi:cytochrome b subunit of formate dehydrogenase